MKTGDFLGYLLALKISKRRSGDDMVIKDSGRTRSYSHFVHHKSHMTREGLVHGQPKWKDGD
jgi:hypothetical protein